MAFFDRVVRPHFDRAFFERVEEAVMGVFASSDYRVRHEGRALNSQFAYARGSERYFALQKAVMTVAVELGAEELTLRSGNFPMPVARHVRFMVAVCITDSLKRLYGSRARRLLASLNSVLEPFQPDLFDEFSKPRAEVYFGMIVVAKRQDSNQSHPAAIYFGVPSSTLRSWHFYERIDNVIGLYDTRRKPIERIKKPRLRRVARSISKPNQNKKTK